MYKVHCLNNIAKVGTDALGAGFSLTDSIDEAEAIMVRSASLHGTEFSDRLLTIGRAGAGVNNIPLERCAAQGIVVFNTPGANANGVKEMVIAGMLLAARDIVGGIEWVDENSDDPNVGRQAEKAKKDFAGTELAGKNLGVIGLGAIGAMVANAGRSLGMHVYGYDPYLSVKYAWSLDRHVRHINNIGEIWSSCDYITIHVPATAKTKGMIGRDEIAAMRDGTVLLNYARDSLVDERALAEALQEGHIARYMTDFANSVTTSMAHATVTPHLGASTKEAEDNCAVMAAGEIRDYLENGNITNSVNYGAVDMGPLESAMRLAVFHLNVTNMIGQITGAISAAGVNIENMTDKSAGNYAYCLLDLGSEVDEELVERLAAIDGIYRVRAIRR
ncbi:MAG: phosphoglycerate dehydrogenase [Acidobacteriota bacterium]|nr:phosphoglycerate dehydrogenase [Acidobacteriota bacterium]